MPWQGGGGHAVGRVLPAAAATKAPSAAPQAYCGGHIRHRSSAFIKLESRRKFQEEPKGLKFLLNGEYPTTDCTLSIVTQSQCEGLPKWAIFIQSE
jgi:hypothetical protein